MFCSDLVAENVVHVSHHTVIPAVDLVDPVLPRRLVRERVGPVRIDADEESLRFGVHRFAVKPPGIDPACATPADPAYELFRVGDEDETVAFHPILHHKVRGTGHVGPTAADSRQTLDVADHTIPFRDAVRPHRRIPGIDPNIVETFVEKPAEHPCDIGAAQGRRSADQRH